MHRNKSFWVSLVLTISLLLTASVSANSDYPELEKIAADSLKYNIVTTDSGHYLRAGGHQFQSLWTRDFSFASRGLFAIHRADVVRDQLTLILKNLRQDGMTGKYFDSIAIIARYMAVYFRFTLPLNDPILPHYDAGIPKSASMDSNSLVLITAFNYLQETGDQAWWDAHEQELVSAYRFYDTKKDEGLLVQDRFEDWQDTVTRRGKTFYVNLLYYAASERLARFPAFQVDPLELGRFRQKILAIFLAPNPAGTFLSMANFPYVSLEANLLAIDLGFFKPESLEAKLLYRNIKISPLFGQNEGIPGFCSYPNYPEKWVGLEPRLVGIKHYHDEMYWSWLMGLSAKVSEMMGDRENSRKVYALLETMAKRDGTIYEVYRPTAPFLPWRSTFYTSESPFSWGSGVILDAIRYLRGEGIY